eukprot:jgi/Bigna1/66652/fgenesh1_pg.2_\
MDDDALPNPNPFPRPERPLLATRITTAFLVLSTVAFLRRQDAKSVVHVDQAMQMGRRIEHRSHFLGRGISRKKKRPLQWTGKKGKLTGRPPRQESSRETQGGGCPPETDGENSSADDARSGFDSMLMEALPRLIPTTQLQNLDAVRTLDGHGIAANKHFVFKHSGEQAREFFQWLIFPAAIDEFVKKHLDKEPRVIARGHSSYYQGWFQLEHFEEILRDKISTLRYAYDIDVTEFNNGTKFLNPHNNTANRNEILKFMRNGASIRLNRPFEWEETTWKMVALLDSFFGVTCGCNVYITPGRRPSGYAPHANDVDNFVLMANGSMRWRVFKPLDGGVLPLDPGPDIPLEHLPSPPFIDKVLSAGDMLYIPRGWIYFAENTQDATSCHVHLSTNQHHTWADYLAVVLPRAVDMAVQDEEFRKTLPLGWTSYMGFQHIGNGNDERRKNFTKKALDMLERLVAKGFVPLDAAADEPLTVSFCKYCQFKYNKQHMFAIDHLRYRVRPFLSRSQMKRSLQPKLTLQGDGSESRGHRESLPSMPAEEAGAANSIPGKRDWVKLTAENVGRYVLGEDCIRVVHCLSNSRGGLGDDSETIELHPRC